MSEDAGSKDAGRTEGDGGEGATWCTQGSQCVRSCLGPRNRPRGEVGRRFQQAWVGRSSPARHSSPAGVGLGSRRPPAPALTPPEAPWLSPPRTPEGLRGASQGGKTFACVLTALPPAECTSKRQAPSSPMFTLGVHKGHENLPRESKHTCAPAGHATLPGGDGHEGMRFPARSPPHALSPRSPNRAADGDTEAQCEKDLSRSFAGGAGTRARAHAPRTSHTCSQTHLHWPRGACAHTCYCTGTSRQEGPRPSSPPSGTPTHCPMTPTPQTRLCNAC